MTTQQVLESSPLGKAIKYTLCQWPKLIRYIDATYRQTITVLNAPLSRWLLGDRTGSSRPIPMEPKRARCFTVSSRQRKPTALSFMTTWLSVCSSQRKLNLISMHSCLRTSNINNIASWDHGSDTFNIVYKQCHVGNDNVSGFILCSLFNDFCFNKANRVRFFRCALTVGTQRKKWRGSVCYIHRIIVVIGGWIHSVRTGFAILGQCVVWPFQISFGLEVRSHYLGQTIRMRGL